MGHKITKKEAVQMGLLTPDEQKLWRLVRGPQQVTALPLNVIHDTTPIEAAMQAN